ncbi:hypothetical protein BT63DRAFT_416527 [Microthyrium microscopicum]|uniref:Uncharacterized protein n=1 Tax=Microthyrium microscopicum TaxID=703497 RepID=A0A6A6U595_9PEZI|nr:hypothetical protein BT63DRAFT_416527 [Microthyrium microscopicum]
MSTKIMGHAGMLWNYPDTKVEKPCDGECTLLQQQAGLEYPNGTNGALEANIDSGMWLHHMVHFNQGPTRWDPVAWDYGMACIPFYPTMNSPTKSERFYTAGNERSVFNYNPRDNGLQSGSGYALKKEDRFSFLVELMNMNMEDKIVYMTMTYEYLPGALPKNWYETKSVWLDAFQCGTSEVKSPQQNGSFSIRSGRWSPNFEGKVISAMGHLHDGGVEVDIQMTADKSLCKTQTQYAETPEYIWRGTDMGTDKVATKHISSMKGCTNADVGPVELKKGQSWMVQGNYDFAQHDGNLEGGKQSEIMAIAVVLIQVSPGPLLPPGKTVAAPKAAMTGRWMLEEDGSYKRSVYD